MSDIRNRFATPPPPLPVVSSTTIGSPPPSKPEITDAGGAVGDGISGDVDRGGGDGVSISSAPRFRVNAALVIELKPNCTGDGNDNGPGTGGPAIDAI